MMNFSKKMSRILILFVINMNDFIYKINLDFWDVPLTSNYIFDSLSSKPKDVDDDIIIFKWVFLAEVTVIL